MSEKLKIPMVVRERLKAARAASAHPDPDRLVALSEHRLSGSERAEVMEHLAACEECRTVLTLSTAETAEIPARREPAARASGSRWRVWRWAALAASTAMIVAIATRYNPQRGSQPQMEVAQNAPAVSPNKAEEPAAEQKQATTIPSPTTPTSKTAAATTGIAGKEYAMRDKLAAQQAVQQERTFTSTPLAALNKKDAGRGGISENVPGGAGRGGYSSPSQASDLRAANEKAAAGPPAVAPALIGGQAASTNVPSVATNAAAQPSPLAKATPSALPATREQVQVTSEAVEVTGGPFQNHLATTNANASSYVPSATWRLHRGRLQKSSDAGQTWSAVEIPSATERNWNAVASMGANVWVGGEGEWLYHSADSGTHWEEQQLQAPASDITVTANAAPELSRSLEEVAPPKIAKISFSDAQHGSVTVLIGSKKQTYTTADGGAHWALSQTK